MSVKLRTSIFAAIGVLILILDSKTALQGGVAGIHACLVQVLPALFPFMVLTMLLNAAFTGADLPLLRPLGKLCRMPQGSESLLLMGLLGGYPAGAQGVAQAYRSGQLKHSDAKRLLGFCSNAGPAFLFGIGSAVFPYAWMPWALWSIHIASAILTGILLPGSAHSAVRLPASKPMTLPQALDDSLKIMGKVCGWILLFRILQAVLEKRLLWMLPQDTQIAIIGLLELANGCIALAQISDLGLRMVLFSLFLALGGLCVTMQTISVIAPLKPDTYITGKLMQGAVSTVLTLLLVFFLLPDSQIVPDIPILGVLLTAFLAAFILVLRKYEKNSSILAAVRV